MQKLIEKIPITIPITIAITIISISVIINNNINITNNNIDVENYIYNDIKIYNQYYTDNNTSSLNNISYSNLSRDESQLELNEIYAKHGYIFKNKAIKIYFEEKGYYGYISSQDEVLNLIKKNKNDYQQWKNIVNYQRKMGWRD